MKSKRILIGLLAILIVSLGTAAVAMATNPPVTTGEIRFIINDLIVRPPYDPDYPQDHLPPDDGHHILPVGGAIHLQVVPRFNFGIRMLGPDAGPYFNHIPPSDPHRPHLVMVWDHRHITETGIGTPTGWRSYAELISEFEHQTISDVSLGGAEIRFSGTRIGGTGGVAGSVAPSLMGGAGSLGFDPVQGEGNRLFIGGAAQGEGAWGTHVEFGRALVPSTDPAESAEIRLHIPPSTFIRVGEYQAKLLWTLTVAAPVMP